MYCSKWLLFLQTSTFIIHSLLSQFYFKFADPIVAILNAMATSWGKDEADYYWYFGVGPERMKLAEETWLPVRILTDEVF